MLSRKDRDRLEVLHEVEQKHLTQREAGRPLERSERMGETVGTIFLYAAIGNMAISINLRRDKGAARDTGFAIRKSRFGIPDCEQ